MGPATEEFTYAEVAATNLTLRIIALGSGVAGTLFWLYSFYGIAHYSQVGDGTGMQWVAVMPLGFIFFTLTLPALILALTARRFLAPAVLGTLGLVAFTLLWAQLLREFGA
jgi:hypothetical protein